MKLFHFDNVDSTNDEARQLLSLHSDLIVTADQQTKGRGRNSHIWKSGISKDILFSYGKRFQSDNVKIPIFYQACSALAVQAFLFELLPNDVQIAIKYPNDVFVKKQELEGKISGSLLETEYLGQTLSTIIVGIGININSGGSSILVQSPVISVIDILGHESNLHQITKRFIDIFSDLISNDQQIVLDQWKTALNLIGKEILMINTNKSCIVKSIRSDGLLICMHSDEEILVHMGDSIRYPLF